MSKLGRILFADDEALFRESTSELLRKSGYACDSVADAPAAMHLLRSREYDLLISDFKMPGNSNLEFIRKVPKIAPALPIIMVSGSPSLSAILQNCDLPVAACLVKPFSFDELLSRTASIIKRSHNFCFSQSPEQLSASAKLTREFLTL